MIPHASFRSKLRLMTIGLLVLGTTGAEAGGLFRKRQPVVVATPAPVAVAAPVPTSTAVPAPGPVAGYTPIVAPSAPPTLGTFYPTPTMVVRGNYPTGGGYSPNSSYGDTSLDIYGPLSALRYTAAPVLTYARGYDGRPVVLEGTSFSTPNLPGNSPVVYPTQATYFFAPRTINNSTPPWWPKATNWIDQN